MKSVRQVCADRSRKAGGAGLLPRLGCVLGVLFTVSACQTSSPVVDMRPTPHTLIYTYLMAHGMARGTVMSGDITPPQLTGLLVADRAALLAVMKETAYPSGANLVAASRAVQQLLAATQPSDYGAASPHRPPGQ
ncbi:hypothetical protein GOB93_14480 [Acetobacter musti]|uniref:DUF4136 domain-containing protein n=1 Tax=Acetobacter musti TaxID=864732 RepID=A0ABX0JWG4_9PROT|nr:hypothetical protein [Acetobacter musti]NHN85839.1 hypothetical protein [Acetobacter musti]